MHNNRHKRDKNHKPIVEDLKRLKIKYIDISQLGGGCGDLVVGYDNKNFIFEIKSDKKSELTTEEEKFHKDWEGETPHICYSLEDILRVIKWVEKPN